MWSRWGKSAELIALGAIWLVVLLVWAADVFALPPWIVLALAAVSGAVATALIAGAGSRAGRLRAERLESQRLRRAARRASSAANRRVLRGVIDGVDAPVFATDTHGVVTVCNAAGTELVSSSSGPVEGRALDELFSHADLMTMHEAAMSGRSRVDRLRLVRDGVARVFDVSATAMPRDPLSDSERHEVVLTFRDVTELAQAMQLKTDFVANASHELRTPLAAIRGAIDTLMDVNDAPEPMQARLTTMIAQNATRLEDLLNDLMDLSRLESPETALKVRRFDLREMAGQMRGVFESIMTERRLELAFDIEPAAAMLETDRQLVEVSLKNLVDNACKFAREGTVIRVKIQSVAPESALLAAGVRFEVTDQGIGIPLQHQQRIFERFYQVDSARSGDPSRRGTGLGLAIVKHAVRILGGALGVESVWQQGTTVWFELPGCVVPPPVDGLESDASRQAG
mgnify:CR=1 FL=1